VECGQPYAAVMLVAGGGSVRWFNAGLVGRVRLVGRLPCVERQLFGKGSVFGEIESFGTK
jgi:hypothetical protein